MAEISQIKSISQTGAGTAVESQGQELRKKNGDRGKREVGSTLLQHFSPNNLYELHCRPQGKEFSTWAAGGSLEVLGEAG